MNSALLLFLIFLILHTVESTSSGEYEPQQLKILIKEIILSAGMLIGMITAALISVRCCKCRTSNDGNANENNPVDNEYTIVELPSPREVYVNTIINNNIYTVNVNQ